MKTWTIGKRITLGFAGVLCIMFVLGILTHLRLAVVKNETNSLVTDSFPGMEALSNIKELSNENVALLFKHISSASSSDMDGIEAKMTENSGKILKYTDNYTKLASPAVRPLLEEVVTTREKFRAVRTTILGLSRAATNAESTAALYLKARSEIDPLALAYIESLNKCHDQEAKEAQQSSDSVLSSVRIVDLGLVVGLTAALVVGCGLAFIIIRGTTRVLTTVSSGLNDGSNQVASAASEVSAASQTLAEGSSEQASSLEETSASLEEMSAMTKRNADNARKANELAKEAREAADKGVGDMQTMSSAMEAIKISSDDIAKIIKTIDEIAFQTNILALNAAVEAARAGEAGMGFAVVADEVRNLAQRCAQAAKETAAKIEGAITKTGQGVEISGKVAQTLNAIVTKVRQVDELVSEVASASKEQTEGIGQVNAAIAQMDKVTQSNAATAEESAAAAQELNAQAELMKQSVAELLQLVAGNNQTAEPNTAASSRPTQRVQAKQSAAIRPAKTTHRNGNGALALNLPVKRPNDLPMIGDFKDF